MDFCFSVNVLTMETNLESELNTVNKGLKNWIIREVGYNLMAFWTHMGIIKNWTETFLILCFLYITQSNLHFYIFIVT